MVEDLCRSGFELRKGAREGSWPTPASSERLGRRRWVIERTISWLSGYRRLSPRCERNPRNYLAFLGLAAALCCYRRYVRLTT
ncbi:transposase [Streptomyces sp. NPDC057424]|uniref:transposase n=1 Tax=Streptomyces sp. NPDC057424 TaxID=3346127 RepID=UPI00369BB400